MCCRNLRKITVPISTVTERSAPVQVVTLKRHLTYWEKSGELNNECSLAVVVVKSPL